MDLRISNCAKGNVDRTRRGGREEEGIYVYARYAHTDRVAAGANTLMGESLALVRAGNATEFSHSPPGR